VHLGEDDLSPSAARRILGEEATIGVSTHDLAAARRAFASPEVDYVAFGPVFASAVKKGRPPTGLDALAGIAREKTKPLVAIGGISLDSLDEVWSAGADSAAMISALNGADAAARAKRAVEIARRRFLPRKIWLVGFMGSGKTTVGRILAGLLDLPFFDLDAEIERTSGKTVRAIFESEGETEFRRREHVFVEGSLSIPEGVFATGGGTFAAESNRSRIVKDGITVFLDPPFEALAARAPAKGDRPLFDDAAQARRLLEERLPFYRMARLSLSLTGAETPDVVADEVLRKLEEQSCVI
jgi:shikimate kinase